MPTSHPHQHEARLLAQLLRSGRVVLLLGEPMADRSGLIRNGLLPLLARRATDAAVDAGAPAAPPRTPERRQARAPVRERTVVFDRWTGGVGGPLAHLRLALAAALGVGTAELEAAPKRLDEALATWTRTHPAQVFLLLDHFEQHLLAPHPGPEHAQVTEELVRLLNRPGLPVSVLLSLTEAAQPQLASLRGVVPMLEDMSLRLKAGAARAPAREAASPPLQGGPLNPAPAAGVAGPATRPAIDERAEALRAPADRPADRAPDRQALRSDDVYALINTTLSRLANGGAATSIDNGVTPEVEPARAAARAAPTAVGGTVPVVPAPVPADMRGHLALPGPHPARDAAGAPRPGWWARLRNRLRRPG